VEKSKIDGAIKQTQLTCVSYSVDVDDRGYFINAKKFKAKPGEAEDTWKSLLAISVSLSFFIMSLLIHRHQALSLVTDKSHLY